MSTLFGTIARLANTTCVVERGSGHYFDGRWQKDQPQKLSVPACIQPLTGVDLQRLPEGQRTRDHVVVFSESPLQTADAAAGTPADVLTWFGRRYEVQAVEAWGPFWKCVAAKVGQ